MEYMRYSIKELASMEYTNEDDDVISIYDLIEFYKNYYNKLGREESLAIKIINIEGMLVIDSESFDIYFKNKSDLGKIEITLDANNNYVYGLNANDKLINWIIKEREECIVKKLYVKITKCPIEIRQDLLNFRCKQLENQRVFDNNLSNKIKMIKRRNLERKKLI